MAVRAGQIWEGPNMVRCVFMCMCVCVAGRADFQRPRPETRLFCWEKLHMSVLQEESKEDSF